MDIKPFGLRATHITDGCGTVVPLCGQTFTFTPVLANTERRCNDLLHRRSYMEGVEVSIESTGFSSEAWAIMTGAIHNEVTDPTSNLKTVSVSQRGGAAFPYFGLYGKALGEEGELDMHMRLHSVSITSVDFSFNQNEYMVKSATAFARDTPDGIYEIVIHEEVSDINHMPSLEIRPPFVWYDSPSNCEGKSSGEGLARLVDLTFTPPLGSRDLIQGTANAQPTVRAYGQNGLTVADFDGTDDALNVVPPDTPPTVPYTVFMVFQAPVQGEATYLGLSTTAHLRTSVGDTWTFGGVTPLDTSVLNNGNWHVHAIVSDGASSLYYLDGVQVGSGDDTGSAMTGATVGADYAGAVGFSQMTFGEMRLYDGAWGETDILALSDGLMEKWGIA